MPLLSFFSQNNATLLERINANPRSFLSSEKIISLAREHGLHTRTRKTNFAILVGSALERASSHTKSHMQTIESLRQQYIDDSGIQISAKCFHNRLDQQGLADFGLDLITCGLKAHAKLCGTSSIELYEVLMQELGVDDIILVDGTEISVRGSLAKECECKGKHHAGLKLHVAFSIKKQSFEHISVTQAVDSERAQVFPKKYKKVLFIMDAGYCSHELEEQIVASGNHFLIKGKTNCAGKIELALDDKGTLIQECYGIKACALPYKHNIRRRMDLLVNEGSREVRIIRAKNKIRDEDKEKFAYLRTSFARADVSAFQIHQLYRLRWIVELFMKCLKSGNSLQGINSSKKEIVLFWICICALCSVLKSMLSVMAQKNHGSPMLSLLKVHSSTLFKGFFIKMITLRDSAYYEARSKLLQLIVSNCKRTKPSLRDCHKLKDIVLLIKSIVKNCTVTDWDLQIA